MRAALLFALTLPGCFVGQKYLISEPDLQRAQALPPPERAALMIPAERLKKPLSVQIRADAIRYDLIPQPRPTLSDGSAAKVQVVAGRKSKKLRDAHILTWIGTALSLAGSALFILTVDAKEAPFYSGLAIAGAGEPLMIAGTVLWVQAMKAFHAEE